MFFSFLLSNTLIIIQDTTRMVHGNYEIEVITVKFSEINETLHILLDSSQSSNTVKAILDNLPIEVNINKWEQESYTDNTPIVAQLENAKSEVKLLDVAYWSEGNAVCLFYGPTTISKYSGKILPY